MVVLVVRLSVHDVLYSMRFDLSVKESAEYCVVPNSFTRYQMTR